MEPLSSQKRIEIARKLLDGDSYSQIAKALDVSTGSVSRVLQDLRDGKFEEAKDVGGQIDMLRQLAIELKKSGLAPGQCLVGLAVLSRAKEVGLDVTEIDRWPEILRLAKGDGGPQEFVRSVHVFEEAIGKSGLNLEQFNERVQKLERKAAELQPLAAQQEEYSKQVAELTLRRDALDKEIIQLERKRGSAAAIVTELEQRQEALSRSTKQIRGKAEKAEAAIAAIGKERQELRDIGLDADGLTEFNARMQAVAKLHRIPPAELKGRLLAELDSLERGLTLEALVHRKQSSLDVLEEAVSTAGRQKKTLEASVKNLKSEEAALRTDIKNSRETMSVEISAMTRAVKAASNQFLAQLRQGDDEILREIRRITDEAVKTGQELGKYEALVREHQWLTELEAMVRGNDKVDPRRIRITLLFVLSRVVARLKSDASAGNSAPMQVSTMERLIKELDAWNI